MNYTELSQAIIDFTESTDPTFESNIPIFIQDTERRIYNSVLIPVLRKNVTGTTTAGNKYLTCPVDFLAPYEMAMVGGAGDGSYSYLLQKDVSFVRQNYPDPTYTGVPQYYAQFDVDSFILAPTPADNYSVELHYYYYPLTIVKGIVAGFTAPVGGTGYVNGTYENVSLTGGNGQGAVATIQVSGGTVTGVTLINGGYLYLDGDVLSCSNTYLGGSGAGFSVTVNNIVNPKGTSWLGDNFPMCLLYGALCEANIFLKGEADLQQNYEKLFGDNVSLLKNYADGRTRNDNFRTELPRGKYQ